MPIITLPAHQHTFLDGSKQYVEEMNISIYGYYEYHEFFRLIPVFGLFYSVYLLVQAIEESRRLNKSMPYKPTEVCKNKLCSSIPIKRYAEACLAFWGGLGVLLTVHLIHLIILTILKIFRALFRITCHCCLSCC